MGKIANKKHLSLDVSKNEDWIKYNHKEHRTYDHVDASWRKKLELLNSQQKSKLFFKYALEGNKKMLKAIYGAEGEPLDINARDKDNNTALMFAVKSGQKEVVKWLLEIGANPNYTNTLGFSPLHLAVRKNDLELTSLIIDNGADINIKGKYGEAPIFDAVFENNGKMIEALIINGTPVDVVNTNKQTPLMRAVEYKSRQEALKVLLQYGADVNLADAFGKNCLIRAIEHQNNAMMDVLIKAGTNLNAQDNKNMTAVHHACKMGNREALRILISKGADVFAKDIRGLMAQYVARKHNHPECAQIVEKAQKIIKSNLSDKQKQDALTEFGRHNRVENSCIK